MSIARVIEISAESAESFEAAIRHGIEHAKRNMPKVEGVWIKDQKLVINDGNISAFHVDMKVTCVQE
jgi:dodecin